jgi:hypothetical protein
VRDCQADNGAWYKRWYRDNGRRKCFDGFLVEAIGELAKDSAKATGAVGKMYYWLEENGYARAEVSDEDRGEGSSKMVKARQIRGSEEAEEEEEYVNMEVSEGEDVESEEVEEVVGKGKGKATEKGAEKGTEDDQNTLQ